MTSWTMIEIFRVPSIGKRLVYLLLGVAAYCMIASRVILWLNLPVVKWGSAASLINTVTIGLLLNFRNRAAYERWWEARGLWGSLINDVRNLSAKLAAFLPSDVLAKSRVAEILMAFTDSLRLHLRDESPKVQQMPGFENETASAAHVPEFFAKRLFAVVADWKREGQIDQSVLWILDSHLCALLNVCGACERIKNTPLSPSYKGLLRTGLLLNVLAEPWLTMPELGIWSLPLFLLVCISLFGVELVDSIVEEPFGKERDDLDLDRYCRTVRQSLEATLPFSNKSE